STFTCVKRAATCASRAAAKTDSLRRRVGLMPIRPGTRAMRVRALVAAKTPAGANDRPARDPLRAADAAAPHGRSRARARWPAAGLRRRGRDAVLDVFLGAIPDVLP